MNPHLAARQVPPTLTHLLIILALAMGVRSQAIHAQEISPLNVGDVAPELALAGYLQGPHLPPAKLAGLKGTVVVIDFWASWCPGCIAGARHLNALVEQFRGDSVVFLTLMNEDEEAIRRSLQRTPLQTWVAIDSAGVTTERYRIGGYPQSVIIDRAGRIAGFVNPAQVTGEGIAALLAGERFDFPHQYFALTGAPADLEWPGKTSADPDANVVSSAILRRSEAGTMALRWIPTPGRIVGDGVPLDVLLRHAYAGSRYTFQNDLPNAQDRYQLMIEAVTPDHDAARALLKSVLKRSFDYAVRREMRRMKVMVLSRLPDVRSDAFRPDDGPSDGLAGRMGFHVSGVPMAFIASSLEGIIFNMPVIDETGLSGNYRIDVDWELDNPVSTIEALRVVGLKIIEEERDIEILIVEPREGVADQSRGNGAQ